MGETDLGRQNLRSRATLVRNIYELVFASGARGWWRSWLSSIGAIGSIALLTLLTGLCILAVLAVSHLSAAEAAEASILHVYLREGGDVTEQVALETRLRSDPRVLSIKRVSKAEALSRASARPGFGDLVAAAGSNPLPEGIDVRVRSVGEVGDVARLITSSPAVDPAEPTSYDGEVYTRLQLVRWVLAAGAGGLLALLCVVAAAVTASCVRGILLARRQEVEVMRLVGSPNWMVRGPFLVDGALTGTTGAIVGASLMAAVALAILNSQHGALSSFLPGILPSTVAGVGGALILGGTALGSLSALAGIRDLKR